MTSTKNKKTRLTPELFRTMKTAKFHNQTAEKDREREASLVCKVSHRAGSEHVSGCVIVTALKPPHCSLCLCKLTHPCSHTRLEPFQFTRISHAKALLHKASQTGNRLRLCWTVYRHILSKLKRFCTKTAKCCTTNDCEALKNC